MKKRDTYEAYMQKVIQAQNSGYTNAMIIQELDSEKLAINARLNRKLMDLSTNSSPFPAREARRLASECLMTIDRICRELKNENVEVS